MNICYIVCALDCEINLDLKDGDLVIGADRGYEVLAKNKIKPDIVIGDFDSYMGKVECDNIITLPIKKDDTDSAVAVKYAVSKGYNKIVVYGAIGGMLDHTIANISLIAEYSQKGIDISFVDGENIIFAITDKICFSNEAKGRISVFSFSDYSYGVFEKGLLYELNNATLKSTVALGVSNEFIGEKSEISVKSGTLLIYTLKKNYDNYLTRE